MDRLLTALVATISLTASAGCGSVADEPVMPPAPPPVGEAPVESPEPTFAADWSAPFDVTLTTGWTLAPCGGDAPLWCVTDGDRHVGVVELGEFPIAGESADAVAGLAAHADDFLASMRDDRARGCPGAVFTSIATQAMTVGGVTGLRAGFAVTTDGREIERNIVYWAVHDSTQYWIAAGAVAVDGCLERLGEFTPADLGAIESDLDAIVASTPLPPPSSRLAEDAARRDSTVTDRRS